LFGLGFPKCIFIQTILFSYLKSIPCFTLNILPMIGNFMAKKKEWQDDLQQQYYGVQRERMGNKEFENRQE
jgi:hypothetical protein